MSLYAVALRFPFTGTKRLDLNHGKQPQTIIPPTPNFTVGTTVYIRAGSLLLAFIKPRFDLQTNSSCANIASSVSLELSSDSCNQRQSIFYTLATAT
uniref:Uncharacterized protein n=1 Tax=Anguilla anguilla TaxID=7936 RepID=A0A0E9QF86_ANGAN